MNDEYLFSDESDLEKYHLKKIREVEQPAEYYIKKFECNWCKLTEQKINELDMVFRHEMSCIYTIPSASTIRMTCSSDGFNFVFSQTCTTYTGGISAVTLSNYGSITFNPGVCQKSSDNIYSPDFTFAGLSSKDWYVIFDGFTLVAHKVT
jgi:hypothetical protein